MVQVELNNRYINIGANMFYLKIFIVQIVYTVCTRINYKIVPVTSFNKYLHYGTNGTE